MWVRKSEEEINKYRSQQEAAKRSWLRPLLMASVLTIIAAILGSVGYRGGYSRFGVFLFSDQTGFSVFAAVFLFVIFFVIALYAQRRRGSFFSRASDSYLCAECKQPAAGTQSGMCNCGGTLEPFAFFNWVEE